MFMSLAGEMGVHVFRNSDSGSGHPDSFREMGVYNQIRTMGVHV